MISAKRFNCDPNHATAYFFRADGLLRQERLEEAVADFTRAIELGSHQEVDFSLADAYLFRGSAVMALGRLDQAAADFSQAIGHREANRSGGRLPGPGRMPRGPGKESRSPI